ncbi:hypothetical protein AB0K48_45805, partial [Nonomuraea sp. NPDC055795]
MSVPDATLRSLRLIPDEARNPEVPWSSAEHEYGLPPDVLRAMLAAGLGGPDGFDHFDLLNVALDLGVRSLTWLVPKLPV